MSQTWASADFVLQNRHSGGFFCCFLLLAICRQVQKLNFLLRLAFAIMPQLHFSMIRHICRCRAKWGFSAWLWMTGKATARYKSKGHIKTRYIPCMGGDALREDTSVFVPHWILFPGVQAHCPKRNVKLLCGGVQRSFFTCSAVQCNF